MGLVKFGWSRHAFICIVQVKLPVQGLVLNQYQHGSHHASTFPDSAFDDSPFDLIDRDILNSRVEGRDALCAGHGISHYPFDNGSDRILYIVRDILRIRIIADLDEVKPKSIQLISDQSLY